MKIVKLYIRLMKKIWPLLVFYVFSFGIIVVGLYFFRESGYLEVLTGEGYEEYEELPVIQQVFMGNLNDFQCYMNTLCFLLVMVIVSGCGFFLQIIHESGISRRSRMLPISENRLSFQLVLANLLYTLFMDVFFVTAGIILFGYRELGFRVFWYSMNTVVFSLTMIAVSYLISFVMKKKDSIFLFSIVYAGISCCTGGFFIPQGRFTDVAIRLAEFTPSYWFVRCNAIITASVKVGASYMGDIGNCLFMECFWAIAFLALAVVMEKERHRKDLY